MTACCLLLSTNIQAQTATTTTSGASPLMNINGGNYQGYCLEYNNTAPASGETYHWDATHEDINLFGVTASLQGHSSFGTDAVQRAVWYFTDNINPPTDHNAWTIIERVENGVYVEQCASEWYPKTTGHQDMMTHNDPHCKEVCDDTSFGPGALNGGASNCGPFDPPTLPKNGSTPASGCEGGKIDYQWQKKDASTNWQWVNISGANSEYWDPGYQSISTWVRRGAFCDPCGASWEYTNVIDIHIVANYTNPGTISGEEFNCGGFDPSTITSKSDPSPYYDFNDSYNQVKWEKRTPGGSWSLISGATGMTYNPGYISSTTEYRRCARVEPCSEWKCSNVIVKEVGSDPSNFEPGSISGGEGFCNGGDAGKIIGSIPTGCDGGTIEYQWQIKTTTGGTWQDVSGAKSQNWDPPYYSSSVWVRRAAKCSPCGSYEYSNVIDIHISENYTSGGTISNDQCSCGPFDPSAITASGPKGGTVTWDGFLNSKWQVMPEGGNWTDISGQVDSGTDTPAVSNTYNPGPITVTTKYRKCFRILPCQEWICSDEVIMEVVPNPTANNDSETICLNDHIKIDVAANDSHNNYNTSYHIITYPNGGSASISKAGELSYDAPNACGVQTIVYEVCNDASNCAIDCCDQATVTITVEDTVNPSLHGVPADITVQCDAVPDPPTVTASDNCDTNPAVTYNEESSQTNSGSCTDSEYTITRIWTATDVCGNTHTDEQKISVIDTNNPVVNCSPDDATLECVWGEINAMATAWNNDNIAKLEACSSDACGHVVVTSDYNFANVTNDCGDSGTTTVKYTITDQCGNNVTKQATVTFVDTTPPMIPCDLINEVHECSGPAGNESAAAAWNAANIAAIEACGKDDCGDRTEVTSDYSFGALSDECGSTGTMTVTFTLTDDCGLFTTKTATFTVEDNTAPSVTCEPENGTFECSGTGDNQSAADTWNASNISKLEGCSSDACASVTVTSDYSFSNLNGGCGGVGSIDVTYTIEDECGHAVKRTATFTIEDNTNPVVICDPDNEVHECTGNSSNETAANAWNTANITKLEACSSDACGTITVTSDYNYNNLVAGCGDSGSLTVTYTIADECGFEITKTATFSVEDTSNPSIDTQASDLTVECDGNGNLGDLDKWLADQGGAHASDICGNVSWSNDYTSLGDDCAATGTVVVTFTAQDDCGNVSTTSASFTIEDTTNPTVDNQPTDLVLECDGAGNTAEIQAWLNNNGGGSASDICGNVSWSNDYATISNECGETGTDNVLFTVTDECGNVTTTSANITIEDTTAPEINVQASDLVVECDGAGNQAELNAWLNDNGGATASDVCGTISWDNDFIALSDDCGGNGSATVIFTVTDDCGNQSTTSATFTIEDTVEPTITSASNQTVECDGAGNQAELQAWLDNNGGSTSNDVCGEVTWSYETAPQTDECGDSGVITAIFTATDDCGNSVTASADFIIEDTTSPTVDVQASDLTVECDGSGNQSELDSWLASQGGASASDDCGSITWTNDYTSLNPDCAATGDILVTFTATDDCGNATTTTAIFTIEDTTNPTVDIQPTDIVVECDGAGNQAELQAWLDANGGAGSASDICGSVSWTNDYSTLSNDCGETGTTTVVFTVTDECGNTSTASANFTIEDTTSPVVDLDAMDMVVECDGAGNQAELNAWLDNNGGATGSDVCGTISWTNDFTALSDDCGGNGSATVIFTVMDDCGNTNTTSATFTIEDTTDPTVTDASDITVECDGAGNQAELQAWLDNNGGSVSQDVCGDVTWAYETSAQTDECGDSGVINAVFTATDDCGNTATTTANFIIEDTTSPTMDVQASDLTVECDGSGNQSELDSWLASQGGASASDDCGSITWTNDYTSLNPDCAATGDILVTFTATDDCGNATTTTATFTIEDTTNPTVDIQPTDIVVECDGAGNQAELQAWLDANGGAGSASDICGSVSWTNDYSTLSDDCGETGTTTVVFTVTDECGNTSTASANFTIEDTTSPVVDLDAMDMVVECDGAGKSSRVKCLVG